jgi:DNA-binding NarL/FixJ family response regulator
MTVVTRSPHGREWNPVDDLTPRQREILVLVARSLTNSQIAKRLVIEVSTVEGHLYAIYGKLAVRSRTEAAILAYRCGLLDEEGDEEES